MSPTLWVVNKYYLVVLEAGSIGLYPAHDLDIENLRHLFEEALEFSRLSKSIPNGEQGIRNLLEGIVCFKCILHCQFQPVGYTVHHQQMRSLVFHPRGCSWRRIERNEGVATH